MPGGRPKLPIGTFGEVLITEEPRKNKKRPTVYRAKALYRGADGRTISVVRYGQTKGRATAALKAALAERQARTATEDISTRTTIAQLADAWMAADHSWRGTTRDQYRYIIEGQVKKRLGGVALAEIRASAVSRTVQQIRAERGPSAALAAKKALSGMFKLAVVNDAMPANPALGIAPIARPRKDVRALTVDQEEDLRDRLRSCERALELDLPDLVEFMLGTGCRLGEACAARDAALDIGAGTWEINATVVRFRGEGLILQPRPKSEAGWRVLALPPFAVAMLNRRAGEERLHAPGGIVFGSPRAKAMRDPSSASGNLRHVLDLLGYEWVTSHTFRKTVATRLDQAGLSARQIADQLGHAKPSMTQDVYMGRRVVSAEAARVLDR